MNAEFLNLKPKIMMKIFTKLLLLLTFSFFANDAMSKIIYVDVANVAALTKDGTSWANAYDNLQTAIDNAVNDDEIWVAQGLYKPSATLDGGADDRDKTFRVLSKNLKLYGGFNGEATVSGRVFEMGKLKFPSILSGDLGIPANTSDNAYHVLVFSDNDDTLLDGFTIENGNANGTGDITVSAGNTVSRNQGGAIFFRRTNVSLNNLVVKNNTSVGSGGAVYLGGKLNATKKAGDITNSEFSNNTASGSGGAIYASGYGVAGYFTDTEINNCIFKSNKSTAGDAGAIYSFAYTDISIKNSVFENNEATRGGALFAFSSVADSPIKFKVEGSTFKNNKALTSLAGALYISHRVDATVGSSVFIGNTAVTNGGAIYVLGNSATILSTLNIYNSILANNAAVSGGGVYFTGNTTSNIINCTLYSNTASSFGSNLYITSIATATSNIYNTLIYQNNYYKGPLAVITEGNVQANVVLPANVFLSTNSADANFLKLKPLTGNPAVDAGDNSKIPAGVTTDLAGSARIYNTTVDLGAYENLAVLPITLSNFSASVKGHGVQLNWTTASETNNSHFLIAQSTDGINFTPLAKVASRANGATYNHTDFSPANGINYYRLTQVDNDGTSVVFDPISVNFSLSNQVEVNLYPNPATGSKITVNLVGQKFNTLQVINLNGQQLQSLMVNATDVEKIIDISNYASGTYFIRLSDGTKAVTKKFVKP